MTKQRGLRLIIHHHHLAYLDKDDVIWLSANIGRWVNALADNLDEVRLVLYQSSQQALQQDTPITRDNTKLYSLGPRRTIWQRAFRRNRLPLVCAEASKNTDGLLIRGITPHQLPVWRFSTVPNRAFLLVESLRLRTEHGKGAFVDFITNLIGYYRLKELRQIANRKTLFLANSPDLVSEIERKLRKPAKFVSTNIICESDFSPMQVRPVATPWNLIYCGRLDLRKGLRELIQAIAQLYNQGYSCHLGLVGDRRDPPYSELRELAQGLGISTLINWHGFIPYGAGLFELYRRADVLVLPSYSEGFPKVYWEAAANCCPVITTAVGGIPALLTHEEQGILIPPKDVGVIVAAVKRLFSDDSLRRHIIKQAYLLASAFTVEANAKKMVNILADEWNLYA